MKRIIAVIVLALCLSSPKIEAQTEFGKLGKEISDLRSSIKALPTLSKKAIEAGHANAEKNRIAASEIISAHAKMRDQLSRNKKTEDK